MIKEINSKSILSKNKKIDSWFLSQYGMNLYRGCSHNCVYCDGRAEAYYIEGDFAKDIQIKTNAIEVLKKELNPNNKRKPFKKGYIIIGGGVCDVYQPIEKEYELTRKTLELVKQFKRPIHILTKSTLVERDIDIIKEIHKISNAIVSFSFSSTDDEISKIFEPNASLPSERLRVMKKFSDVGINTGIFLMPVIPLITDGKEIMKRTLKDAKENGAIFSIFGTMTLKPDRQKRYFMDLLKKR